MAVCILLIHLHAKSECLRAIKTRTDQSHDLHGFSTEKMMLWLNENKISLKTSS